MVSDPRRGYDFHLAVSTPLAFLPSTLDRSPLAAGAQVILDARLWCVIEVCVDVPSQTWEPRLLIFRDDADDVAAAGTEWIRDAPELDVRLAGYTRDTLQRVGGVPAAICHVAGLSGMTPLGEGG